MITIFNRKELFITYDMKDQANVRELLSVNHIDYHVKVIDRNSPGAFVGTRARFGALGQDMSAACEYIIYVRKSDYDMALSLMNRAFKRRI